MLLTAVVSVLILGAILEGGGKLMTAAIPEQAININTVSSGQAVRLLGAPITNSTHLRFESVHELLSSKPWRHRTISADTTVRLIVRTPLQAAGLYISGWVLFIISCLLVHLFLQRVAAQSDQFIFPMITLLAGIGLLIVFDVKDPYRDTFSFTGQALGVSVYGVLAFLIPFSAWFRAVNMRRSAYVLAALSIVLLILMRLFGHGPGGVPLQVAGVEPVEFIKVLLALYMAAYLIERTGGGNGTVDTLRRSEVLPILVTCGITGLLFVVVKDLGPVILITGTAAIMLFLMTGRLLYPAVWAGALSVAAIVGYFVHLGFLHTRIVMWLAPWSNGDPHGSQLAEGFWGFTIGGLTGSGLGLGEPGLMPRAGSDLIFASVGEELGLIGCLCILTIYCALICRGLRVAYRASTSIDRAVASALTGLTGLQTCAITAGVSGLLPLTGVTLPFIAHGTSSLVSDYFCAGILISISGRRLPIEIADRAPERWLRSADRTFLAFASFLLVAIGLGRLAPLQLLFDRSLAGRPIVIPDADGVSRPHFNPRLLTFAASIPKGRIFDRNGIGLSQGSAAFENRKDLGGGATSPWLSRVEGIYSANNPMGQGVRLRGYNRITDLVDPYRYRCLPLLYKPKGRDVTLTMDYRLQLSAYAALQENRGTAESYQGSNPDGAAMVVVDSRSGQVLAEAALPSPNCSGAPNAMLDRALDGRYAPGSTFKIVTADAGLTDGMGDFTVICKHELDNIKWQCGSEIFSRKRITDENGMIPHGFVDMTRAISLSCNVYFAQLGLKIGADDLSTTARARFGLSFIPDAAVMCPDLADSAYGQGEDVVTPLQMAMVAQTIANEGNRLVPSFTLNPKVRPSIQTGIPTKNAQAIGAMMLAATQEGTASGIFDRIPVQVAGKTGSAQLKNSKSATNSWFIGYAPADSPKLAFACIVEHGGAGRAAAAPACRHVLLTAVRMGMFDRTH